MNGQGDPSPGIWSVQGLFVASRFTHLNLGSSMQRPFQTERWREPMKRAGCGWARSPRSCVTKERESGSHCESADVRHRGYPPADAAYPVHCRAWATPRPQNRKESVSVETTGPLPAGRRGSARGKLVKVAGHRMPGSRLPVFRHLDGAFLHRKGAPGVKCTAGGRIQWGGHLPRQHYLLPLLPRVGRQ